MKKECSNCEFNFGGICAGHGEVYKYGEEITDNTKCCDDWGASFDFFCNETTTAPRFLREAFNDCRISYNEFSEMNDAYTAGRAVPINIFDAVKAVYGISMVDIAVVLGVSFGVVYRAKTKGFAQKRITQFSNGLCIPEKLLQNITTNDFDELEKCKEDFFKKPKIKEILESVPEWKEKLAREISSVYLHCPIHIARKIARVDKIYWNKDFSMDDYTESEQVLIGYISRESKNHEPAHSLEYSLDIACSPHMSTSMIRK